MPPSLQIDAWFRLLDLYNFDVVERTVTANVLHHLSWTDQRISMHGNCPAQILSADIFDKVWVPDLDVDHFRSFSIKSIVKEQKFLKVSRQKSRVIVDYSFSAAVTISCSMNLDRYPFADTTCKYRLVSYKLDSSFLLFKTDPKYNITQPHGLQESIRITSTFFVQQI